jgi:AraC-like DNA-binding protein
LKLPQTSSAVDPARSRYASFEAVRSSRLPQILLAGFETVLTGYRVDRSSFPTFAIEMVVAGQGALKLDGEDHELGPGTVFTYGPGVHHVITTDPASPLQKYFLDVSPSPSGKRGSAIREGSIFTTSMADRMASVIDGILNDSTSGRNMPEVRQASTRLFLALAENAARSPLPPATAAYSRFIKAKAHIEAHFYRSGCVEDYARELHIDVSYLTRLFQQFAKETPYRFLTRLRLTQARHLLLRHDLSIQQIAESLHFANPYHFSTLFRKHYSVPPSHFRRRS